MIQTGRLKWGDGLDLQSPHIIIQQKGRFMMFLRKDVPFLLLTFNDCDFGSWLCTFSALVWSLTIGTGKADTFFYAVDHQFPTSKTLRFFGLSFKGNNLWSYLCQYVPPLAQTYFLFLRHRFCCSNSFDEFRASEPVSLLTGHYPSTRKTWCNVPSFTSIIFCLFRSWGQQARKGIPKIPLPSNIFQLL